MFRRNLHKDYLFATVQMGWIINDLPGDAVTGEDYRRITSHVKTRYSRHVCYLTFQTPFLSMNTGNHRNLPPNPCFAIVFGEDQAIMVLWRYSYTSSDIIFTDFHQSVSKGSNLGRCVFRPSPSWLSPVHYQVGWYRKLLIRLGWMEYVYTLDGSTGFRQYGWRYVLIRITRRA